MKYALFLISLAFLGAVFGLFCHWLRGIVGVDEMPFGKGNVAGMLQGSWFEQHVVGARFTDMNAWDLYSLRNMAYMAFSGAIVPLVVGLMYWKEPARILVPVCRGVGNIGLTPLFC